MAYTARTLAARVWEIRAYSSCFSRETLYALATISEVQPIGYNMKLSTRTARPKRGQCEPVRNHVIGRVAQLRGRPQAWGAGYKMGFSRSVPIK